MSSQSVPANRPRPRGGSRLPSGGGAGPTALTLRVFDGVLILAFLALTFLLGVFPLKDTDFWWHLRTGDMIRQTGRVPQVDPFLYGVSGRSWIDLHWVYQVSISWLYAQGGVPLLTLVKCAVTTLAVLLLVTARRREWPVWAMLVAWLPALLVLGGRMYVRPETLTLLYLAVFLAVLWRIDRWPALALVLPVVQVAWVNTQGLFVFGPILIAMALVDAALRPGAFAPGRARWWRVVLAAALLTGLACLVNPYGLTGALYPLQLARTMSSPVFALNIAELTPVLEFIRRDGLVSLPLRLHLFAMAFGALSFLVPMGWRVAIQFGPAVPVAPPAPGKGGRSAKGKARRATKARPEATEEAWHPSVFRFLLFAAFSVLSFQATRNSHQFAAVVGVVTAWNLGEWAWAVGQRARQRRADAGVGELPGRGIVPRLAGLAAIAGVLAWVASGSFYEVAREGRTIGLGEQPLWFPHEAVQFAGSEGMPPRFLSFHIGHASLYEYEFGPARKAFVDARLEVIGPELFGRYMDLNRRISDDAPGWAGELEAMGRPIVLADHELNAAVTATLLTSPDWRCVWFDPIAALFVHAAHDDVVQAHQVDFAARHFRPDPATDPRGPAALLASARGLRNVASLAGRSGPDRIRPLVLLGLNHARRYEQAVPGSGDGWKMLGQLEMLRDPPAPEPAPRFRMPFDPVFDLSAVRATSALRRAVDAAPDDFSTLMMLEKTYEGRAMTEAAVPLLERMVALTPINGLQARSQEKAASVLAAARLALGPEPPATWQNREELRRIVGDLLARGRAATAATFLEKAEPADARPWDEADRIATLWLHLGEPARARSVWENAPASPRPALRTARVAVTHLVEGNYEAARAAFHAALAVDGDLFEAHYSLAVLEQDIGRAADALKAARRAEATAQGDVARTAARSIVAFVTPYAVPPVASGR
jgi:hypothetical protein